MQVLRCYASKQFTQRTKNKKMLTLSRREKFLLSQSIKLLRSKKEKAMSKETHKMTIAAFKHTLNELQELEIKLLAI